MSKFPPTHLLEGRVARLALAATLIATAASCAISPPVRNRTGLRAVPALEAARPCDEAELAHGAESGPRVADWPNFDAPPAAALQDSAKPAEDPKPAAGEHSTEELAKLAQNPIANLISLPFQNNTNFGLGPHDRTQNITDVQPVIPISLDGGWNLITRTILPLVYQPDLSSESGGDYGTGDMTLSAFVSPPKDGDWMFGFGPILYLPTASIDDIKTEKYGIGPTAVAVYMHGQWVAGALANQVWSVAGDDDLPDVSSFLLQPFVNYNLSDGWFLSTGPIITANWEADSDDTWTVPIGGGGGKLVRLGKLPLNIALQFYYNVISPDDGPDWTIRLQLGFLFPK